MTGNYTITVTAANINSDGVPNNGTSLDQDFALVAYNAIENVVNSAPQITSQPANTTVTGGNDAVF